MKNKLKKIKKITIIIIIILLCPVLLTNLCACNPDGETGDNGEIINNGGDSENPGNASEKTPETPEVPEVSFTSKEIADAVMAVFPPEDIPENTFLLYRFSGADEDSEEYLSLEKAQILIENKPGYIEGFDYLEDYAFYYPPGNNFFEVSVLRMKKGEESKTDAVKNIFERRLKRPAVSNVKFYNPQEEWLIDDAKIITAANYVILLVTTDNKRAEEAVNDLIYGKDGENLANNNTGENPDQSAGNTPVAPPVVSMDGVVNIEPAILFDFAVLADLESHAQSQGGDPSQRRTSLPRVTVKKHSHNTMFLLGGKCEEGAMIRVTGGLHEIYTSSEYGNFLVEIPFAEESETDGVSVSILRLTAEAPGKSPSNEITFIVKPRTDVFMYEEYGNMGVVVGYNFSNFFDDCLPDYLGTNLIGEREAADITSRTKNKIQSLKNKGCSAEIIYLIAPNMTLIWPENMPVEYTRHEGETLFDQWKKAVTAGGATVIDLHGVMISHKNDEFKIWHRTDSHWTEYGAYIAYVELMNYIAKKFPDAAPRPITDFEFYNMEMNFGDIYKRIEVEPRYLQEKTTFANFNFDPPHFNPNYDKGHLGMDLYDRANGNIYIIHDNVAFAHETKSNVEGDLPSVYVLRDSYEGCLHAFYTDRFSKATFQQMWSYGWFDENVIAAANPDYILYVVGERNMEGIAYS